MWVVILIASCNRIDMLENENIYNTNDKVILYLSFDLDNGTDNGTDAQARANRPGENENLVPGTGIENTISSLHLFWKINNNWRYIKVNSPVLEGNEVKIEIDKNDNSLDGIEMWLGANLNDNQAEAFMKENEEYRWNNSISWAGEFAPFSLNSDIQSGERSDISMFCRESSKPELIDGESNKYKISFNLKRVVAKILVTCKQDGQGYVSINNNNDSNFDGWIKGENVYYAINGVNKSAYIMQRVNDGADYDNNVIDPNNNLSGYLDSYDVDNQELYLTQIDKDFYYYDVNELMSKSESLYKRALKSDDTGNYSDGIYCPENTFIYNNESPEKLKGNPSSWGMITSVSVKAKFSPKELFVEGDLFDYIINNSHEENIKEIVGSIKNNIKEEINAKDTYKINCLYENISNVFLRYSLIKNNFVSDKFPYIDGFPSDTYFYHNTEKEYYTYGAAKNKVNAVDNTTELGNYEPYYGGWGYYFTYIDNRLIKNNNEPFDEFYKYGQVERNRYYVITINSFSNPGSSSGNANYIEVNTEIEPWKDGGSGDVVLE